MEQLTKQFDGSYSTPSGFIAVVPNLASVVLPDGTAIFEFRSSWNSEIISVRWDSAGPIAVLERNVGVALLTAGFAKHPSEAMVDEYNALVIAQTPAITPPPITPPVTPPENPPADTPPDGTITLWQPPEGWQPHPTSPGYFYKGQEVLTEEQLRAL